MKDPGLRVLGQPFEVEWEMGPEMLGRCSEPGCDVPAFVIGWITQEGVALIAPVFCLEHHRRRQRSVPQEIHMKLNERPRVVWSP